jgi:hypothetical protein
MVAIDGGCGEGVEEGMPKIKRVWVPTAGAGEVMAKRLFNPVELLMDMAESDTVSEGIRAKILMSLMEYAYPKIKSADDSSATNLGVVIEIKNYTEAPKLLPDVQITDIR